jgi:hypothetical protein
VRPRRHQHRVVLADPAVAEDDDALGELRDVELVGAGGGGGARSTSEEVKVSSSPRVSRRMTRNGRLGWRRRMATSGAPRAGSRCSLGWAWATSSGIQGGRAFYDR